MRVMIVDDERLARVELRRLLSAHPQVEIAGEAATSAEAQPLINALHPDLLLLDVQMPGGSGFDLLEQLDWMPAVIFTTAFDAYALKAFEVNALDYLLKPISPDRLAKALERVELQNQQRQRASADERIFVKDGERCWFVQLKDINLFESEGNYTRVYFASERPLILRSLQALEERLDSALFFRASRKHIVNLQAIESVQQSVSGGLDLKVRGGFEVEMSRRRAADFRVQMSL